MHTGTHKQNLSLSSSLHENNVPFFLTVFSSGDNEKGEKIIEKKYPRKLIYVIAIRPLSQGGR